MTKKQGIIGGGLAVGLVLAVIIKVFWSNEDGATVDMYEEASYICENDHEMTFSREYILEYQKEHYGQKLKCPECGSMKLTYCERDPDTGELTPKEPTENERGRDDAPQPPPDDDYDEMGDE